MKRISLKVSDVIKNILPETIEKDLQDNEIICPTCHGLGVVKCKNHFGIKDEEVSPYHMSKINWYDNEAFTFCPDCYNGVRRLCEFCGKPIPKGYVDKCDCKQYQEIQAEKSRLKWRETVNKAKCIDLKDVETYLYCAENDKFYDVDDINEFVEEFAGEPVEDIPTKLWVTSETSLSLDACNVCESACEELHEDASDNIDYKTLQDFLDQWCKEQTGTATYYPCYKEYVKVDSEWFK